jgi:hypothetical protein
VRPKAAVKDPTSFVTAVSPWGGREEVPLQWGVS